MLPTQLLIVGYEGTRPPPALLDRLASGGVGGAILFGRNIGSLDDVAASVASFGQAAGDLPPFIAVDQEGGRVQRLREPLTRWPAMLRLGERDDPALCERVGQTLGEELRLFGFNVDLAPVLDVHTNPANPVIGDRSFGTTAEGAARGALSFWRGLERAGVRGCGKHFPGHGDTLQDSHLELPRVDAPLDRLRRVELPPFEAAVAAGMPMLMTAHVVYPAVDDRPATMSSRWIDGMLRRSMGFGGVVVSDDLDMKAVAGRFPVEEVIREGLAAGVDLFLACRDPDRQEQAAHALTRAAVDPTLGPRVEAALARVHALRRTLSPAIPTPDAATRVPDPAHRALAASI